MPSHSTATEAGEPRNGRLSRGRLGWGEMGGALEGGQKPAQAMALPRPRVAVMQTPRWPRNGGYTGLLVTH